MDKNKTDIKLYYITLYYYVCQTDNDEKKERELGAD